MTTKIKATNIWKKFNNLEVLKGIDLEVNEGEVVAVIGPSGGGKSTLLRCLNKLETIDKGSITIDGEELCRETSGGTEYVTMMSAASPAKWAWYSSSSTFFLI